MSFAIIAYLSVPVLFVLAAFTDNPRKKTIYGGFALLNLEATGNLFFVVAGVLWYLSENNLSLIDALPDIWWCFLIILVLCYWARPIFKELLLAIGDKYYGFEENKDIPN